MRITPAEREELNWLISREIPSLRRYAYILLGDSPGRDDLVQDTLERAMKKVHTWRREGNIRSWLYRIQYTVFLNRYHVSCQREMAAQETIDQNADSGSFATQEQVFDSNHALRMALNLPQEQREILLLVAVEGMAYDEVADIMDIAVGTVRSRLSRARESMRAMIAPSKARSNSYQEDNE